MLVNSLFVGLGGFAGSVMRYLCSFIKVDPAGFPIVTLGINVIGSFAILFLTGIFAKSLPLDSHLLLFLRVGLCGGFTTFSTFSAEALGLIESGNLAVAAIYIFASCTLCILASLLGEVSSSLLIR